LFHTPQVPVHSPQVTYLVRSFGARHVHIPALGCLNIAGGRASSGVPSDRAQQNTPVVL